MRTDIPQRDVFISWTGADRHLKDEIVTYLTKVSNNNITCLESDETCCGQFEEWSEEAVGACSIFLLILTENTLKSKYVPKEIKKLKELDSWENRLIPICSDKAIYQNNPWGLCDDKVSAIYMNGDNLTAALLDTIHNKVVSLLVNRMVKVYHQNTSRRSIPVFPLCGTEVSDAKYPFEKLYIPRKLTETDMNKQELGFFETPHELFSGESISFVYGPAGCGKSQYISQIRAVAGEEDLVISLSCQTACADEKTLKEILYDEFLSACGNREFYTFENFGSLLSKNRLILILDGMDEIGTEESTRRFVKKLEKYYASNEEKTVLIFTSRSEKDAKLLSFGEKEVRRFRLDKLTDDEIKQLSNKLFILFKDESKGEGFYASVQNLSDEIRANPLLLSQLAIIYNYDPTNMPKTELGILDAISRITLRSDLDLKDIREQYRDMIRYDIVGILKEFAKKRYILISDETTKNDSLTATDIFSAVFNDKDNVYNYGDDSKKRAEQLVEYLQKRAIMVEDRFYHKMLLEYFTAVAYFEQTFDDYGKLKKPDSLGDLFSHYENDYWSPVIKLFLVKADSKLNREETASLYSRIITENEILDYTLLFDTCRDLINHKVPAQMVLIRDILLKSVTGKYPPYGPLFWYVPEYELYEVALMTLDTKFRKERKSFFAKALALIRDVCCIFAKKYTVSEINGNTNGQELFDIAKGKLTGIRRALCEYFCLGEISNKVTPGEENIYPRCFNINETMSLHKYGYGLPASMKTAFKDPLGLYKHTSLNLVKFKKIKNAEKPKKVSYEMEHIGFISFVNDTENSRIRFEHPTLKIRGIAVAPSSSLKFGYIPFTRTSVTMLYIPENATELSQDYDKFMNPDVSIHYRSFDKITVRIIYVLNNRRRFFVSDPAVLDCGAFSNRKTSFLIYLADGIEYISFSAFSGSSLLCGIRLPSTLKRIHDYAFFGCTFLRSISLPDSLEHIGRCAFWQCENLRNIVIPDKITTISQNVFFKCSELKEVKLPESIREIGERAFKECKKLTFINTPSGLERIGKYAFSMCESLSAFDFPDSFHVIEKSAFERSGLQKIKLPDSLKVIENDAFSGCKALSDIVLPKNLTEINHGMFSVCKISKIELPEGIEKIDSFAFACCYSISEIYFPKSVKIVEKHAFTSCKKLKRIFIPDSITSLSSLSFAWCGSLSEIRVYRNSNTEPPKSKIISIARVVNDLKTLKRLFIPTYYEDVASSLPLRSDIELFFTETGAMIHKEYSPIYDTVLIIPEGIEEIPEYKYKDASIETVILPKSLKKIGRYAFQNCSALTRIEFPEGLMQIGSYAFDRCESLTEVILPEHIIDIPAYAFSRCSAIQKVSLPKDLIYIRSAAFKECSSLTRIDLPYRLEHIGYAAFEECCRLSEIKLPQSLTTLEGSAFHSCSSLTRVELPEGLTNIPTFTFSGCAGLREINIPNSVKIIDRSAFEGCTSLPSLSLPCGLEKIGDSAFANCHCFTEITIPISVSEIVTCAFSSCINLERVFLHDSLEASGVGRSGLIGSHSYIFAKCKSLKEVDFTRSAGRKCKFLSVAEGSFKECVSLKTVRLPKMLYSIGKFAFEGCTDLEEIEISETTELIHACAFKNCVNLKRVKLPANLKTIKNGAFLGCTDLEFIEIPDTVTEIGDKAFEGCEKLNPSTLLNQNFKARAADIFGIK